MMILNILLFILTLSLTFIGLCLIVLLDRIFKAIPAHFQALGNIHSGLILNAESTNSLNSAVLVQAQIMNNFHTSFNTAAESQRGVLAVQLETLNKMIPQATPTHSIPSKPTISKDGNLLTGPWRTDDSAD